MIKNPNSRLTAEQAFNHQWFKDINNKKVKKIKLDSRVLLNLNNFTKTKVLKKVILQRIAFVIPEKKIQKLKDCFTKFDKNGDGELNLSEFKLGIKNFE